jgi:phage terminase small subunit
LYLLIGGLESIDLIFRACSGIVRPYELVSASEQRHQMKTPSRKQLRETIKGKDIGAVLSIPRGTLTQRQKRFAEALVLEGKTGADAYRSAGYSAKGKPKTIGDAASRLKADCRIQAEIAALEHAKQVAALHSAEALRSLVISSLTSALIDPETKPATRIQAAKVLGQVTEVAAFTERKEITHIKDSGAIRSQILDQLKSMMLASSDVQDIDANELLQELTADGPHPTGTPPNAEWDSGLDVHTIPLERFPPEFDPSEDPPSPSETHTPRGDISGENGDLAK